MREDEIKVSDLSQAEDILSNDILMIVQSLYNKKVPFALLKNSCYLKLTAFLYKKFFLSLAYLALEEVGYSAKY